MMYHTSTVTLHTCNTLRSKNGSNSFQWCLHLCLAPASINSSAALWSQLVDFSQVRFVSSPRCHRCPPTHTAGQRALCVARWLHHTFKGKFHPQVPFGSYIPSVGDAQSIPPLIWWLSVAICCGHCSTSQTDLHQSPQIKCELVAFSWLCVGGGSRSERETLIYSYQEKVSHTL